MKFAARINSFMREQKGILESIRAISSIKEIRYLDMNFNEHFKGLELKDIKHCISDCGMQLNGVAIRFRSEYLHGGFTNPDPKKRQEAIEHCLRGIDHLKELGGKSLVIWMEHDGFNYAFQTDYEKYWNYTVEAFQKISDYDKGTLVSIEYKPFQPKSYAFIADISTSMLLIHDAARANFGITLDYCHMLMKHENPAQSISIAASRGKLFGIHFNDGYGVNDDGLIIGTGSFLQSLEFIYYLRRVQYQGVIYFDTFPTIENPRDEACANVALFQKMNKLIDTLGLERIENVISKRDAIAVSQLLLDCLK